MYLKPVQTECDRSYLVQKYRDLFANGLNLPTGAFYHFQDSHRNLHRLLYLYGLTHESWYERLHRQRS
ncbi:hypothetical protein D3C71_1336120 [compost metagenome]